MRSAGVCVLGEIILPAAAVFPAKLLRCQPEVGAFWEQELYNGQVFKKTVSWEGSLFGPYCISKRCWNERLAC